METPASDEEVPPPREGLVSRWLDGELVLLDRPQGKLHHLNATASFVFSELAETRRPRELAERLMAACAIELEVAERDVQAILQQFRELDLLGPAGVSKGTPAG